MNMQNITIYEEGTGVHILIPNTTAKEITNLMAALLVNSIQGTSEPAVEEIPSTVSQMPEDAIPTKQDELKEKEILADKVAEDEAEKPEFDESELPWNNSEAVIESAPEYKEPVEDNEDAETVSGTPESDQAEPETVSSETENENSEIPAEEELGTSDATSEEIDSEVPETNEKTSEVNNAVSESPEENSLEAEIETSETKTGAPEETEMETSTAEPEPEIDTGIESPEVPEVGSEHTEAQAENNIVVKETSENKILSFKAPNIDEAKVLIKISLKSVFDAMGIKLSAEIDGDVIKVDTTDMTENHIAVLQRVMKMKDCNLITEE